MLVYEEDALVEIRPIGKRCLVIHLNCGQKVYFEKKYFFSLSKKKKEKLFLR